MEEDISKKSVAILLILVTLLSVIGTFAVMSEINKIGDTEVEPQVQEVKPVAKVRLNILDPEKAKRPVSTATGRVVLEILPQKGE